MGEDDPVPVNEPGLEVTVYELIAFPPVAGSVNTTEAKPLLYARPEGVLVATTEVGVLGTVVAVTDDEAMLGPDVPIAFVVAVVNV